MRDVTGTGQWSLIAKCESPQSVSAIIAALTACGEGGPDEIKIAKRLKMPAITATMVG